MNSPKSFALAFIAIAGMLLGGCASLPHSAITHPATSEAPAQVTVLEDSTAMIPPGSVVPQLTEEPKIEQEVDPTREAQIECLAKNIYFEARGESTAGRKAVGQVTINRAKDGRWPNTLCGVVQQKHQFSWYWDKIPDVIRQPSVYQDCYTLAASLYDGYYKASMIDDVTRGATHFHSRRLKVNWRNMKLMTRIDNHVFLRLTGRL
jgi:spore germination cell wall hydrolase CwlJ-like protein